MARKGRPGLRKRGDYWHIEKVIKGHRIYESTGEKNYRRAEAYYDDRIRDIRQSLVYGHRPAVTFREAAEKFLIEDCPTKSLERAGYAQWHTGYCEGGRHHGGERHIAVQERPE